MENSKIKDDILLTFKLNGFSLKSDATSYLLEYLTSLRDNDIRDTLDKIVCALHKQELDSSCIARDKLEVAINEFGQHRVFDESKTFTLLNATDIPKMQYDPSRKRFTELAIRNAGLRMFGTPEDKANVCLERYHIVYQRLLRHELFAPFTVDSQHSSASKYQLTTVENLLASSVLETAVAFGMLVQLSEDKFYLEDPTGVVQLDLANAEFQTGLYTEHCLCLVEGSYQDDVLVATAVGFAPIELASNTYSHYFSSAPSDSKTFSYIQSKLSANALERERERQDATILFLSDVWLDSTTVVQKLRTVLDGFVHNPPTAVVLAGDFLSKSYGAEGWRILKEGLKNLSDLILRCPTLAQQTHFVFVPSLRDPLLDSILPKPPLPNSIVQNAASKIPNCHFASNPCRLRYCTQDILVFREDIVEKMCRNCVRAPVTEDGKSVEHHFAKTILAQSHLAPLPLHVSPVYWPYDYALRIYPLPDLVVCADKYKAYTETLSGCIVTNPGSFARDGSFQVYFAARRQVEDSEI